MMNESLHETHAETHAGVELWTRTHLGRLTAGSFTLVCRGCGGEWVARSHLTAVEEAEAHRCG